jgi:small subunit ribosomal protein S19
MSRSIWKGPFISKKAIRNSVIIPEYLNKTFQIHNGKIFKKLFITQDMIGHKFGEFVLTRKQTIHKKK